VPQAIIVTCDICRRNENVNQSNFSLIVHNELYQS